MEKNKNDKVKKVEQIKSLLTELYQLRVTFDMNSIKKQLNSNLDAFLEQIKNIYIFKKEHKATLNALKRDFFIPNEVDQKILKERLKISFFVRSIDTNPKGFEKEFLFEIKEKNNPNPPIYFCLIPTKRDKRLVYTSFVSWKGDTRVCWGEPTHSSIKKPDFTILKKYLNLNN